MKLFFERILLKEGWKQAQTLTIEKGVVTKVTDGFVEGAETIKGPAIPGMINCHSHAFQRAFAGFSEIQHGDGDSFWSWRDVMYKFLKQLSVDDIGIIARQLYIEMLKAGYTRVAEFHYLHFGKPSELDNSAFNMAKTIFEAAKCSGIGLTLLPVLYQFSGFGEQPANAGQKRFTHSTQDFNKLVTQCFELSKNYDNTNVGIAPHSLRAVNKESLLSSVAHIRQLDPIAPIHIHIAEQQKEVEDSLTFYGKRPVQWLLDNIEVDKHWCLIHATHIDDNERATMVERDVVAGICPTTEANLGDGIFPTAEFLSENGVLAIGSDSHISVNPVEELRWLEYTQRLVKQQRAVLASAEQPSVGQFLWESALKGGSRVTSSNIGILGVGMQADILVLDEQKLANYASDDRFVLDSLIFASQSNMVECVMVNGKWVIKDGAHKDEAKVSQAFTTLLTSLSQC
jgi:formimidoylglutamate deiminase